MIGLGIVLAVIGAILSFAVSDMIEGVDLTMIGYILMAAGAVAFLIGLVQTMMGRSARSSTVVQDNAGTRTVESETELPPREV
ncbi:MAG: DUF6458 family protein [bacterium]|nr:DUF6458 family protein [bacterium]